MANQYEAEIEKEAKGRMYPLIVAHLQENQRPPSLSWLMEAMGYVSTSTTRSRVNALVKAGWLRRKDGNLEVVGAEVVIDETVEERLSWGKENETEGT